MNWINIIATNALIALSLSLAGCGTTPVQEENTEMRHIDFSKQTPTAQVEFQTKSIRLFFGGGWGSGILKFQGKEYPIKIKKLSVGGIGYKELNAVGDVYFLEEIEDIIGGYTAGTIGATVVKGRYRATYENKKGVIISMKGKSSGLALSLGVSRIAIKME